MNRSVLLVLDERRVLIHVIVVAINDCARVEPGRAVLELQAHADELGLDLVDRLGTEVADVEQVGLAAPDELTHGVDALALEAVVGPVSYTHLRAHETDSYLVCRLLLEKKKKKKIRQKK